jgi:3-oxoacyl-[acyl-carrier-protein] synthase II
VVGLGAVTGYGWGRDALAAGLGSKQSAARQQVVDGLAVVAATIPERFPERPADGPADVTDATSRYEQAALYAVADALDDARAHGGWEAGDRVGVVFCTGIGDIRTTRDEYFRDTQPRPSQFAHMLHTSVGSLLSQQNGWTGPNLVLNAACSSGNAAFELAAGWIAGGVASDVIVAGTELCLIAEIITGFRRMRVLLADGAPLGECRPFQDGSRRFFLGEAAIAFVVTAATPGAPEAPRPRATYLGGAITHDAFHLVAPEPEGIQLERCYRDALAAAGVGAEEIALVKAHGSGTPLNDTVEAALLDRLFPPTTEVCSYKPLVGHCMAVASLVELASLVVGYEIGALPPHVTDDPANPRLPDGGPPPDGLVLCGSVGLGGANTAAVFDIPRGDDP